MGVVDVPERTLLSKVNLTQESCFLSTLQNKVVENNDLKADIASELPYLQWLEECKIDNHFEEVKYEPSDWDESTLFRLQKQFAYTKKI